MSDSTDPEGDAWAKACAEDLAAEQSRRQQRYGSEPGSAASELGKLVDSVAQRIAEFTTPLAGAAGETAGRRAAESAAEQWTRQLADGAKAVLGPVAERNPKVLEHLAAAGSELLSAYQAAVSGQEQRWTKQDATSVAVTRDDEPESDAETPATADAAPGVTKPTDATADRDATDGDRDRGDRDNGDDRDDGDDPPGTERVDLD